MTRSAGGYEHIAVCEAWTHPSGWELRLSIDGTSSNDDSRSVSLPRCASWSRRGRSRCWRRAGGSEGYYFTIGSSDTQASALHRSATPEMRSLAKTHVEDPFQRSVLLGIWSHAKCHFAGSALERANHS